MQVVTATEMQAIEKQLMEKLHVSPLLLMENAGSRIVEILAHRYGPLENQRIHILAGTGNNGGDGLVVARKLLVRKAKPKVYLIGKSSKSSEFQTNLGLLQQLGVDLVYFEPGQTKKLRFSLGFADIIIDAIFGTGFKNELPQELNELIELVNELNRPVVSIDIPTGVQGSSGSVTSTALQAELTVNLGLMKVGNILYPGRAYAGENVVVDLGFPLEPNFAKPRYLTGPEVLNRLPARHSWGHKKTFGHVLVVGGSRRYAGAPVLSAQAVLRGGAGLVTLAVPRMIAERLQPNELMVEPLVVDDQGFLGETAWPQLAELLPAKDVLVVGPGLGLNPATQELTRKLLQNWQGPAVIDADGLRALTADFLQSVPKSKREKWLVTPHPGEMAFMINSNPTKVNARRLEIAEDFAVRWEITTVLKGAPTIIADGQNIYINTTGNHGLATAGTGDVLTGLIGALLAQGTPSLVAALAGVYVHGAAGDLAASEGAKGLIATDCLQAIRHILA